MNQFKILFEYEDFNLKFYTIFLYIKFNKSIYSLLHTTLLHSKSLEFTNNLLINKTE